MTIVKPVLPEEIFTTGEYVPFDQIVKGDTIVRGGVTVYGEEMKFGLHISRAHNLTVEEYFLNENNEPTLYDVWSSEDSRLGSPSAFRTQTQDVTQPFFYRLPLSQFQYDELGNLTWTKAVLKLIKLEMTEINVEDITSDMFIMDVWLEPREEYNQENNTPGGWINEITIGYTGELDEWGWTMKGVTGFTLATISEGSPSLGTVFKLN